MTMDAGTHSLPEVVIRDILRRIDVKSLIRFQCVSKQWKTLINAPSFIEEHLRRQSPCLLLHRSLRLRLLDRDLQAREVQVQPSVFDLEYPSIVGSSNGLLCLRVKKELHLSTILLWNPAIRELRMTPRFVGSSRSSLNVGFGFSPIINDYKVVIIWPPGYYNNTLHVKVYSLISGSWKSVDKNILEGMRVKGSSVTANGVIFWHVGNNDANMILSFDIAMEELTLIPFPVLANHHDWYFKLAVYENKLAMLVEDPSWIYSTPYCIDLWVMDEGDDVTGSYDGSHERWSWTKKCNASFPCKVHPLTIWNNEIACQAFYKHEKPRIALFNVNTSEFNVTGMHDDSQCIEYVESLVPVGGNKFYATFT